MYILLHKKNLLLNFLKNTKLLQSHLQDLTNSNIDTHKDVLITFPITLFLADSIKNRSNVLRRFIYLPIYIHFRRPPQARHSSSRRPTLSNLIFMLFTFLLYFITLYLLFFCCFIIKLAAWSYVNNWESSIFYYSLISFLDKLTILQKTFFFQFGS